MEGAYEGSFGWAHAPERDRKLLYSSSMIYNFRMAFFQRSGEKYTWKELEDLAPYRIGITIGNHYSDEFAALQAAGKLNVDPASADAFNMKKLASGRIDLFPMEQESGTMLADLTLTKAERTKIVAQSHAIWEVPVYVVINRQSPRAQELVDRFDQGYRKLSPGRLKHLIEDTRRAIQKQRVKDTMVP
jgi:polar amino acid transport system substrate-binding protein